MKKNKKIVAVIPARYQSSRFEGKPLAKILGKPMVLHVYDNVKKCALLDDVIVATEDQRIVDVVEAAGGKAMMTSDMHPTGSDRVAEAAAKLDADIIVNVQGDEPLVSAEIVEKVVRPLVDDDSLVVSNLITPIDNLGDYIDNTVVKAAVDKNGFLLFLTRAAIPYPKTRQKYVVYKEVGIYSFRRDFLLDFVKMEQTQLELIEGVEFLRLLENGCKVRAVVIKDNMMSVDTISDLIEVEKFMKNSQIVSSR